MFDNSLPSISSSLLPLWVILSDFFVRVECVFHSLHGTFPSLYKTVSSLFPHSEKWCTLAFTLFFAPYGCISVNTDGFLQIYSMHSALFHGYPRSLLRVFYILSSPREVCFTCFLTIGDQLLLLCNEILLDLWLCYPVVPALCKRFPLDTVVIMRNDWQFFSNYFLPCTAALRASQWFLGLQHSVLSGL